MVSDTVVDPKTESAISQWPPVAHIVHKKDLPAKEGTIALCGARLMGISLNDRVEKSNCPECVKVLLADLKKADL